jgi:hypothetical protein
MPMLRSLILFPAAAILVLAADSHDLLVAIR